jgi:hypothetical protein
VELVQQAQQLDVEQVGIGFHEAQAYCSETFGGYYCLLQWYVLSPLHGQHDGVCPKSSPKNLAGDPF